MCFTCAAAPKTSVATSDRSASAPAERKRARCRKDDQPVAIWDEWKVPPPVSAAAVLLAMVRTRASTVDARQSEVEDFISGRQAGHVTYCPLLDLSRALRQSSESLPI